MGGGGGGGRVKPKVLVKLSLEMGVKFYQKVFGVWWRFGVSTPFAFHATVALVNGRRLELNLIMHPIHPKNNLSGR